MALLILHFPFRCVASCFHLILHFYTEHHQKVDEMHSKILYSLASAVVVLSWLSTSVHGVAIHHNTIEAWQGLTAGETVIGGV